MQKPEVKTESAVNVIRGKNLVGKATQSDILLLLEHIDALHLWLDELDSQDFFGTEGWRHVVGIE